MIRGYTSTSDGVVGVRGQGHGWLATKYKRVVVVGYIC